MSRSNPEPRKPVGYWPLVWRQFRRSRAAMTGLWLTVGMFVLALVAPFLAHRLPLVWIDAAGNWSFPLFREFFAPSDTTERALEIALNYSLIAVPLAILAWRLAGRFVPAWRTASSGGVALGMGILLAAAMWMALGSLLWRVAGESPFVRERYPLLGADDLTEPARIARALLAGNAFSLEPERAEWEPAARRVVEDDSDAAREALADAVNRAWFSRAAPAEADAVEQWRRARTSLEAELPGLVRPFREMRWAFLTIAAVTFLSLAGLTAMLMAGARELTASPRWIAVLAALALAAIPFLRGPRNNPEPYRALAAAGQGRGLFPPLPYGPNEQGFGPRQPPTWITPPARIAEADILRALRADGEALRESVSPAARRAFDRLAATAPDVPAGSAAWWNRLLAWREWYEPAAFPNLHVSVNLKPYLAAWQAGNLSDADAARMNRLLAEEAFPGMIRPVMATQWKKPHHNPGYHVFGTDASGRDVLTRLLHGARVSLSVGFVAVAISTVIGLVLGSVAGYYGGRLDILISRFIEFVMCFPSFFLVLAMIAVLDKRSILNIMLVIGLTGWTGVARLIRGEILRQKKLDYAAAAVALGASDARTIFRHLLPNSMAPVLVSISFGITGAILTESSLSFIGFGVTPPTPTWGQLLNEAREAPQINWWLATFPGLLLFLGVFSYNLVGEGVRDALDPRMRQ